MNCDLCGVERDLEHVCVDALKAERERLLLQVDQMRPVVEAAIAFEVTQESCAALLKAVKGYTEKRKSVCPGCDSTVHPGDCETR